MQSTSILEIKLQEERFLEKYDYFFCSDASILNPS